MMLRFSAALAVAGLLLSANAAQAAASPDELCKGGQLVSLRTNTIKPGAKAAYEKAAKDHIGWYRAHGYKTNRLLVGPVISGGGGNWTASETEYASVHFDAPGVPRDKRDAGWDAYVKEYKDSSDIGVEKFVCLREVK